ncbi:MAG: hypothetical protein ACKVRO_01800 [Micropepsaceae bacterium]
MSWALTLATAASLAMPQVDTVTIVARGAIPGDASGIIEAWIEFDVRRSSGDTEKMYLPYWNPESQSIPEAGAICTVSFARGLVNGIIEGTNRQMVRSPIENAFVIESLRCRGGAADSGDT